MYIHVFASCFGRYRARWCQNTLLLISCTIKTFQSKGTKLYTLTKSAWSRDIATLFSTLSRSRSRQAELANAFGDKRKGDTSFESRVPQKVWCWRSVSFIIWSGMKTVVFMFIDTVYIVNYLGMVKVNLWTLKIINGYSPVLKSLVI